MKNTTSSTLLNSNCKSGVPCKDCVMWIEVPFGERLPMVISLGCIAFFSFIAFVAWVYKERKLHKTYYGVMDTPDEEAEDEENHETVVMASFPRPGQPTPIDDIQVYRRRVHKSREPTSSKIISSVVSVAGPEMTILVKIDHLSRGQEVSKCFETECHKREVLKKSKENIMKDSGQILHELLERMTLKKYVVVAKGDGEAVYGVENIMVAKNFEAKIQLLLEFQGNRFTLTGLEATLAPPVIPELAPEEQLELPLQPTPLSYSYKQTHEIATALPNSDVTPETTYTQITQTAEIEKTMTPKASRLSVKRGGQIKAELN